MFPILKPSKSILNEKRFMQSILKIFYTNSLFAMLLQDI